MAAPAPAPDSKPTIKVEVRLPRMDTAGEEELLSKMLGAIGLSMDGIELTQWEGEPPPARGEHVLDLDGELQPKHLLETPALKKKAWALLQEFQRKVQG